MSGKAFRLLVTSSLVLMAMLALANASRSKPDPLVPSQGTGARVQAADCEKARELCVESCGRYRKNCDANHPNDQDYCVKQQNSCEAKCQEAWRTCSEMRGTSK